MRIKISQFLGNNHSWSVVGHGIARSLIKLGHQVDLFSTDGIKHFSNDLKPNLIGYRDGNNIVGHLPPPSDQSYDCQISYTAMKNFQSYLGNGKKNRFGIFCYEWNGKNVLPTGFAKNYKYCDLILAPSNFAKDVFVNSGVPSDHIKVIPHGISEENYRKTSTIQLPTKKKFKILANIAQNHLRKNIPGLLDAYGKAFTEKDDVCLLLKAKEKPITAPFDISLNDCLKDFNIKYPKHGEIKLLTEYYDDVSDLYRSVDAVFTMSFCECFYFPALEALASGKINIAPNYGGQIDFLNSNNSLLVEGKEERADPKSMYWENKNNAIWFRPSIDDAVDKLRYAYNNFEELNKKLELQKSDIISAYSWEKISFDIMALCK